MPTSEQIEAAAKAMYTRDPIWSYVRQAPFSWDDLDEDAASRDYWRDTARAALEAVEALTRANVSNGPVSDIPGGEMSAEAFEEVEWEYGESEADYQARCAQWEATTTQHGVISIPTAPKP